MFLFADVLNLYQKVLGSKLSIVCTYVYCVYTVSKFWDFLSIESILSIVSILFAPGFHRMINLIIKKPQYVG